MDRRHQHIGGQPLLSDDQLAQLWLVLCGRSPDGGLWNGRKVADWMGELIGRQVSRQRGWEYLQHMKFRLRTRLPQHQEVDLMELEVRKKKGVADLCNDIMSGRFPPIKMPETFGGR